jgi:hypothetical protein
VIVFNPNLNVGPTEVPTIEFKSFLVAGKQVPKIPNLQSIPGVHSGGVLLTIIIFYLDFSS